VLQLNGMKLRVIICTQNVTEDIIHCELTNCPEVSIMTYQFDAKIGPLCGTRYGAKDE
jgi:hypothetical protein